MILASSGGGTQAGLELGQRCARARWKTIGISVLHANEELAELVCRQANATAEFLGVEVRVAAGELEIHDDYLGEGYGAFDKRCADALALAARTEGIFLDPVYTGKAMAGLVDLTGKGRFTSNDTVVFVHTGGVPALFAYSAEVDRAL